MLTLAHLRASFTLDFVIPVYLHTTDSREVHSFLLCSRVVILLFSDVHSRMILHCRIFPYAKTHALFRPKNIFFENTIKNGLICTLELSQKCVLNVTDDVNDYECQVLYVSGSIAFISCGTRLLAMDPQPMLFVGKKS